MGYIEISCDLSMDPSDANVKTAKDWLSKQKKCSQPVYSVLTTLIDARPDEETMKWFESWMQGRDLDFHNLFFAHSTAAHDWLLRLLRNHNNGPNREKIWYQLLFDATCAPTGYSEYPVMRMSNQQLLIDGASEWFIAHASAEDHSKFIARCLTELTTNSDVHKKAFEILKQSKDPLLASNILKHNKNDDAIEIAYQIMNSVDLHHGSSIASALMKADPRKHWSKVEPFLQRHQYDNDRFPHVLSTLISCAPQIVAPLAFEWIDEHPKSKKISTIVSCDKTQEVLDAIWAGLQTRTTADFAPEILEVLLLHFRALSIPKDATDFGDAWAQKNQKHKRFFDILSGLLRAEATETRLKLARDFLDNLAEEDRGASLMVLRRRAPKHFNNEALAWAKKHPHSITSNLIVNEHKHNPESPDDEC